MSISGSCFSVADLNGSKQYLYAKYKLRGVEYECELIEENEDTGETEIRLKNGETTSIKTKKLYDFKNYNYSLWF